MWPDASISMVRFPSSASGISMTLLKNNSFVADTLVEPNTILVTTTRMKVLRKRTPVSMFQTRSTIT